MTVGGTLEKGGRFTDGETCPKKSTATRRNYFCQELEHPGDPNGWKVKGGEEIKKGNLATKLGSPRPPFRFLLLFSDRRCCCWWWLWCWFLQWRWRQANGKGWFNTSNWDLPVIWVEQRKTSPLKNVVCRTREKERMVGLGRQPMLTLVGLWRSVEGSLENCPSRFK